MPFGLVEATTGLVGGIAGAISGGLAMFYHRNKIDQRIESNDQAIRLIEKTYMPRAEIVQMHRDNKDEMKSMHRDLNMKLDEVIVQLGHINVTLAGKQDK